MTLSDIVNKDIDLTVKEGFTETLSNVISANAKPGRASLHLEQLARQLSFIYAKTDFSLDHPLVLFFSADHGFYLENFAERAEVAPFEAFFSKRLKGQDQLMANDLHALAVDVGLQDDFENQIDFWIAQGDTVLNRKMGHGSRDFSDFPATTSRQAERAFIIGYQLTCQKLAEGHQMIFLGHLSRGVQYSAAALLHSLYDLEIQHLLADSKAQELVDRAVKRNPKTYDPFTLLTFYGGLDICAMCGAAFAAAEHRVALVLNDIAAVAAMATARSFNADINQLALLSSRAMTEGGAWLKQTLPLTLIPDEGTQDDDILTSILGDLEQCRRARDLLT